VTKKHIKIYIVLINFGQPDHTIECIQSILVNDYQRFQIIVVDVLNINESLAKLNSCVKNNGNSKVKIINAQENMGFAFANNIGIRYALQQNDCDYLWLLNNDTVIDKSALSSLVNFFERKDDDNIGIVGSKILDYKNKEKIQSVGGKFNYWTKFPNWIGAGQRDEGQFDKEEMPVDHVLGASMFFKKSLIKKIGFLPEEYFLYFEDADWCAKSQRKGFQNWVCTTSHIYHKQGVSTGVNYVNDEKYLNVKKYFYISLLIFYRKYFQVFLPYAYFFLLRKMMSNFYRKNYLEAKIILKIIFNSNS